MIYISKPHVKVINISKLQWIFLVCRQLSSASYNIDFVFILSPSTSSFLLSYGILLISNKNHCKPLLTSLMIHSTCSIKCTNLSLNESWIFTFIKIIKNLICEKCCLFYSIFNDRINKHKYANFVNMKKACWYNKVSE